MGWEWDGCAARFNNYKTLDPAQATRQRGRLARGRKAAYCGGFGGFISFHGSLTFGIVSNSTLARLPFTISVRRI
jgi:hypothetical protein